MVDIPTNIVQFGSHACFGYRALEKSFGDLTEFFQSVMELCGTNQLPCPSLSPRSSPGHLLDQRPLLPLEPQSNEFFTPGDFVDSDEDLEVVIARLQQEETLESPFTEASIRYSLSPSHTN